MITGILHSLEQAVSVSLFSLRTLPERKGSALSALFGIAGVVAVLVGVLSIAAGFRRTMEVTAQPRTAIVMRSGANTELMSGITRENVRVIADAPGVAQAASGALASAELFVIVNLPKRTTGTDANVPLRGVEPAGIELRQGFELVEGRMFEWGRNEVIVGNGAAVEFGGTEIGSRLQLADTEWTVVGRFTNNGGADESELWADVGVLQPSFRRTLFQSVYVQLESAEDFRTFKDALTVDPRLNVKILRQSEYYEEQAVQISNLITGLGTLVAVMMAIGAVFGALNTMYTAVSARTREIATLRALGFHRGPIVVSVMFESLVLALLGGAVGCAAAYFIFDGFRAATMNWSSFTQVAFAFDVTGTLLLQGVMYATLIGLIGGLFPAVRAARLSVATALREL